MCVKKILIVEDEAIIRMDLAMKLEKNGYEVVGMASNDEEVMDCLKTKEPDLMLMDISLEYDVDGIELVREIHKTRPIPVIYLTSYSDSATIHRSMETGPYGYIIKPFTTHTLLTTISLSSTRIALEQDMKKNNSMLQTILDNTQDGIAVVNRDDVIIRCNSSFCKIFCLSPDAEGLIASDIIPGHRMEYFKHSMYTVSAGGQIKRLLISSSHCDQWHILTVTDLTEAETFKSALGVAEQRFSTIFKKKLVPAVLINCQENTIYDFNDKFAELYQAKDLIGKTLSEIIGDEALQRLALAASADDFLNLPRIPQKKADGTEFFADFRGNRIHLDGKSHYLIDVEDITEKIKIENMEKELKVQMFQTNKMTALGTLVSGVAHELNNPNNFIMFNSSLLIDYFNDIFRLMDEMYEQNNNLKIGNISYVEAKSDILQLINGSVKGSERIRDIVQDLKGFARQDPPLNKERIDINVPIKSAVRILQHMINKSTDRFSITTDEPMPLINGSMQKLEQMFINIIINAVEALTAKSQHIAIKCYAENGNVTAEISDGGLGISPDALERITEPFYTTKQSSGGTGLGLSIVYSIIKDHNGRLDISSTRGAGTTVKVTIPAVEPC